MDAMLVALRCVAPIFFMLAVGYIIRLVKLVPGEIFPSVNRICLRVLMPCSIFLNVYRADFSQDFEPKLFIFLAAQIVIVWGLSFLLARKLFADRRLWGAWVQTCYRTNLAVMGIALAESMMGEIGPQYVAMGLAFTVPLYNGLAVAVLEMSRGDKVSTGEIFKEIGKNPLVIAAVLGFAVNLIRIPLPDVVTDTMSDFGKAGTVMLLISLGATIDLGKLKTNRVRIVHWSLVRLFVVPLLTIGIAILMGFRGNELGIILIFAASPCAMASFPMAQEYGADAEITGQVLISTSVFCCLSFFFWIWLTKALGFI